MLKTHLFTIILLSFSLFSYSQNISVSIDKVTHKSNDTIQLRIANKNLVDLYYAVGLELEFDSKWEEFEPTLNQTGKVELWGRIMKSTIKNIKVILPTYLKNMKQKNNLLYIRFHVKSGITTERFIVTYTEPILINLNY
jgi:hypothetical protein